MKKMILISLVAGIIFVGCGGSTSIDNSQVDAVGNPVEEDVTDISENDEGKNVDVVEAANDEIDKYSILESYVDFLQNNEIEHYGDLVFQIDYINEDDIPDLIVGDTEAMHASNIYILSSDGSETFIYGPFGSYNSTSYIQHCNVICTSNSGMGVEGTYYSKLENNGESHHIAFHEDYMDEDYEEIYESHYYIYNSDSGQDVEVTEDEFNKVINPLIADKEFTIFSTYDNLEGYSIINQDAFDNLFYFSEF